MIKGVRGWFEKYEFQNLHLKDREGFLLRPPLVIRKGALLFPGLQPFWQYLKSQNALG